MSLPPPKKPAVPHGTSTQRNLPPTHQASSDAHHGRRYRVRDKDWVKVWGQDLSYTEASRLLADVTGGLRSRTARVEDMEIGPAPHMTPAQVTEDGEPVVIYADAIVNPTPAPPVKAKPPVVARPRVAPADPQLASLQAGARGAASVAAQAAQKRRDDLEKADKMIAKAAEFEKMLEGDEPLDENVVQGILDDVGAMPSDEEISAAHANGAGGDLVDDDGDSDAPAV